MYLLMEYAKSSNRVGIPSFAQRSLGWKPGNKLSTIKCRVAEYCWNPWAPSTCQQPHASPDWSFHRSVTQYYHVHPFKPDLYGFLTYPNQLIPFFFWHTPSQNHLIHGIRLLFPLFTCNSAPRFTHISPFSNWSVAGKYYYCWSERKNCFMFLPHYWNSLQTD